MSVWNKAVDAVLEATVAGSFTRIGARVREKIDGWAAPNLMEGRVVIITGATSGIGLSTAHTLAQAGATIEIVARNEAKAAQACTSLRETTRNEHIAFVTAEMGDLDSIRGAASKLLARHSHIDVLIHNAGALDDVRRESADGIEQTIASHVVGPFLLTALLTPALEKARPSRVIWVSSGGMYSEPLSVQRLEMSAAEYDGVVAYARAKRAQVTLAQLLGERLREKGIVVHSMHPGWVDTPGVERSLPRFRKLVGPLLRTPAQGADTVVWLATDSGAPLETSGLFWLDRRPRATHRFASTRRADTPAERERLWNWAMHRSGVNALNVF